MTNIEQGIPNDEGKNARTFELEGRPIDFAPPFDIHHSLFDILFCCALVYEH